MRKTSRNKIIAREARLLGFYQITCSRKEYVLGKQMALMDAKMKKKMISSFASIRGRIFKEI